MHDDRPAFDGEPGGEPDGEPGGGLDDRGPLKVSGVGELLSLIPYMIGFPPEHSLIVLGFTPGDDLENVSPDPVVRLDLPPDDEPVEERDAQASAIGEHLASVLTRHEIPAAALAGYGTAEAVTPFGTIVENSLREAGVQVVEFVRVEDDRYWSCICTDSGCCPPEGKVLRTDTRAAAQAVFRGYALAGSREELRAMLAVPDGDAGERARAALTRAADRLGEETGRLGYAAKQLHILEEGERLVPDVLGRVRDGAAIGSFDDAELARLLILLRRHKYIRDLAWGEVEVAADRQRLLEFWCEMVRRADAGDEAELVLAPACILAYVALRRGHGALVNVALDLADEADSQYMLAKILRSVSVSGLRPDDIPQVKGDELAASLRKEKERLRREAGAPRPPAS